MLPVGGTVFIVGGAAFTVGGTQFTVGGAVFTVGGATQDCYWPHEQKILKSSYLNGQAIKRGGGVKGRPLRKKNNFYRFFFKKMKFKNNNYFTFDNLSKYGHIMLKIVGRYFIWVVTIFSQK